MNKLILAFVLTIMGSFSLAQAASLQISSQNVNIGTLPRTAVRVPFLAVNLKAVDGSIAVQNLTVERMGLSQSDDFGRIWAQTSNYRRTNARQLNNDDQVVLEFRNPLQINNGEVVELVVYANLNFESGGRTARLSLVDIEHNGISERDTHPITIPTEKVNPAPLKIRKSGSVYDRTQFRIKCKHQRCRLVPRD